MIKGLSEEQNAAILREACRFKKLTRLVVFGSRVMGNLKHGSDVTFVIRFESINNPELRQHITDSVKTIFSLPGENPIH